MDAESYATLSTMALAGVELISLEDFERGDTELLQAKETRNQVEYYFTCTPSLPLYVLKQWPEVDLITYLDADLYFFSDPAPIYEEIGEKSIAVIPHRFPKSIEHFKKSGIYNVGWLSFRRDEEGLACLKWWRDRCNEWCYDQIEPDRFADQKYLDQWPNLFKGLSVIQHKGANLAPWNVVNYELREEAGRIWVDEQPLIFFHFHGLKPLFPTIYDSGLSRYGARLRAVLRNVAYVPYVREIMAIASDGAQVGDIRQQITGFSLKDVLRRIRLAFRITVSFLQQNLIVLMRG